MEAYMRKKYFVLLFLLLLILFLQFGLSPTLNYSSINNTPDGYDLELSLTANQLVILNENAFAYDVIEKTISNDFKKMQFCYDEYGYPCELNVIVYTNALTKLFNKPSFRFRYAQEIPYQYDIAERPDCFELICY